ncbi:hypothetical protein SAMN04488128_10643 [Chitinophaga eiseniae]|uniref:DUF6630 domain-containing protein n=1 Tax=Chitinophaga eiseniae TaxID=634771 RepID=A0A1T4TRT5_9BACT|nr:hypothetical protein [Chitinophaga eiseniae]SKA42879.1 hypothetical protein SAMN04488128_10643 [Chitinophaga eiseniae]
MMMPTGISQADFNWLTNKFGQQGGNSRIDTEEDVIHEIFPDKVVIGTRFLNCATYELSFEGTTLVVKKSRLDDYQLGDAAHMIADELDAEDVEELTLRWNAVLRELKMFDKLQAQGNARELLSQLYLDIFEEDEAEEQINNLPETVPANVTAIWEELQVALQQTGNLTDFEWRALSDEGVFALNELSPLVRTGAILEAPTPEDYEAMLAAEDFAKALLDYFNEQLEAFDLKIVAIGPALDEYQSFSCFPMQDFRLANAVLKMEELCLVCFF